MPLSKPGRLLLNVKLSAFDGKAFDVTLWKKNKEGRGMAHPRPSCALMLYKPSVVIDCSVLINVLASAITAVDICNWRTRSDV